MADADAPVPTPNPPAPDADLSIEDFIARGNARDRGEDIPDEPTADAAAASAEPDKKVEKVDGRTREGRKKSIQQEIDELAATKHATRAEIESAKSELRSLHQELADLNRRTAPQPPAAESPPTRPAAPPRPVYDGVDPDDPEPELDQFRETADPYTAWVRAGAAWEARKSHRIFLQQQNERFAALSAEQAWRQKLSDAQTRIPDFQKRIDPDLPVDVRVMPFIQRHRLAGDIIVYLSEHPGESRALLSLDPIEQIGRIGEIV